jgi:hypothetical protein
VVPVEDPPPVVDPEVVPDVLPPVEVPEEVPVVPVVEPAEVAPEVELELDPELDMLDTPPLEPEVVPLLDAEPELPAELAESVSVLDPAVPVPAEAPDVDCPVVQVSNPVPWAPVAQAAITLNAAGRQIAASRRGTPMDVKDGTKWRRSTVQRRSERGRHLRGDSGGGGGGVVGL